MHAQTRDHKQVSQKPQKEMQVDSNNLYTVTQQWQKSQQLSKQRASIKNCWWVEWEMFVSFPFISSNHNRFFNVFKIFFNIFAV